MFTLKMYMSLERWFKKCLFMRFAITYISNATKPERQIPATLKQDDTQGNQAAQSAQGNKTLLIPKT